MEIFKINIECEDNQTKKIENFGIAYLINMETEDYLFQEINNNGINNNLLASVAFNLGIGMEDLAKYEYAVIQKDNAVNQIYFLPKSIPMEIKQDLILKYIANNNQTMDDTDGDQDINNELYIPESEDEEDLIYCYKLDHFSDLNGIPVTNGSIVKDEFNQKYLITNDVLHDYLEGADFPEEEYLVLDDVMKMLV